MPAVERGAGTEVVAEDEVVVVVYDEDRAVGPVDMAADLAGGRAVGEGAGEGVVDLVLARHGGWECCLPASLESNNQIS